mgnify:CR=1 FL=1
MLGVGVIGLGVGAHHARAALNHPGVGGVLLRDLDQDRANALAAALKREFPGKEVAVAQTEAGLTDAPGIGAVCVASWDEAHFSQIMAALRAGKHVFAEKPLCQSPGQASAIREALFRGAAPSGGRLRLSANMVLRTCPLFREIRQAWREGAFGPVSAVDADYLWGRPGRLTRGWRGRMADYSIVRGAAVHMIDLILWLAGERPEEVFALGNNLATAGEGFPFADSCALSLRFPGGLFARVGAMGGCVVPHFHRLAVHGARRGFAHELTGSVWIEKGDNGEAAVRPARGEYPARDKRPRVLAAFLDAVCGREGASRCLVPENDVFDVMAVCFAADESLRAGRPVRVEYPA